MSQPDFDLGFKEPDLDLDDDANSTDNPEYQPSQGNPIFVTFNITENTNLSESTASSDSNEEPQRKEKICI